MSKVLSCMCVGLLCLAGMAQAGDNGMLVDDFAVLDGGKYDVSLPSQDAAVEIGIFQGRHTELQLRNGGILTTKEGFKGGPVNVQFAYEANFDREEELFVLQSDGIMTAKGLKSAQGAKVSFQKGLVEMVQITNGAVKVLGTYELPKRPDGAQGFPRGAGVNWYNLQLLNANSELRVIVSPIADPASSISVAMKSDKKPTKGGDRVVFMNHAAPADKNGTNSVFLRHLRIGNSALAKK